MTVRVSLLRRCPGHRAGASFDYQRSRLIRPTATHDLLPSLDDRRRKFALLEADAATGFRPHFKQRLIAAE
jgi:hypothetical protein